MIPLLVLMETLSLVPRYSFGDVIGPDEYLRHTWRENQVIVGCDGLGAPSCYDLLEELRPVHEQCPRTDIAVADFQLGEFPHTGIRYYHEGKEIKTGMEEYIEKYCREIVLNL